MIKALNAANHSFAQSAFSFVLAALFPKAEKMMRVIFGADKQ